MPALRNASAVTGPATPPPTISTLRTLLIGSLPWDSGRTGGSGTDRWLLGHRLGKESSYASWLPHPRGRIPSASSVRGSRDSGGGAANTPPGSFCLRGEPPFCQLGELGRGLAGGMPLPPGGQVGERAGVQLVEQRAHPGRFGLPDGELVLLLDQEQSRHLRGMFGQRRPLICDRSLQTVRALTQGVGRLVWRYRGENRQPGVDSRVLPLPDGDALARPVGQLR